MPNRLANETSPYLLQHKDNPVDWHPWGDEAFEKAKQEDKPVLLSVGYSACHWCHVMERESFEDEEIARQMNENFVSIKVDREERPDVDAIYMAAVQALTGQGGWPMTVFLTPEGRPYFGGTYFPSEDRGNLPSFPRVLEAMADAYHNRKGEVLNATNEVASRVQKLNSAVASSDPLNEDILEEGYGSIAQQFDHDNGGFGMQPKFPQPLVLEYLLRHWKRAGSQDALDMADLSLQKMAQGGIYDQVGGGFARYSVDHMWLVPHFEKMLYDNALLTRLYTHAWQATGKEMYRTVVEETFDYLRRDMLDPSGGFYSAQDADSEGEEGKYYVWLEREIDDVLGPEDGQIVRAYYGVTDRGNFEGKNILWVPRDAEEVASGLGMGKDEVLAVVERCRPKLLEARYKRVPPARDDKVLTSWNAMMLESFAEAGAAFDRPEHIETARRTADFLLESLFDGDRMLRSWKPSSNGGQGHAKLKAYLEDYALLGGALLTLYEATFETRWLETARWLADGMIGLFWEESDGAFYDTGRDHEQLFTRPRDVFDNVTPCGNSAACVFLLRLATFTGEPDYTRKAQASMRTVRDFMARAGTGFSNWLAALDYYLSAPKEVVIMGSPGDDGTRALLREVWSRYLPNRAIAGAGGPVDPAPTPLLEARDLVNDLPTAYVCENYACMMPVNEPSALAEQLED